MGDNNLISNEVNIILCLSEFAGSPGLIFLEDGNGLVNGILDHHIGLTRGKERSEPVKSDQLGKKNGVEGAYTKPEEDGVESRDLRCRPHSIRQFKIGRHISRAGILAEGGLLALSDMENCSPEAM